MHATRMHAMEEGSCLAGLPRCEPANRPLYLRPPADPLGRELKESVSARDVPVVTFAVSDKDADVYAEKVKMTTWEVELLVRTPLGRLQVRAGGRGWGRRAALLAGAAARPMLFPWCSGGQLPGRLGTRGRGRPGNGAAC